MISAGRVLIKPCGEWNAETTYYMLDLVNYKGYAYLAKRTVVGIEPSADPNYWHNMLDINKIIEEGIAGSLADDVGKLLEERFAELLSEARYVTDLFADFDVPTFVRWDTNTSNTPYTAGLTSYYEGYALVFGKYSTSHTISAWAKGGIRNDCFTHTVSDGKDYGWDTTISASGGTMTGPLGLGGGNGFVSADENGSTLSAKKDENNYRELHLANPNDEDISLGESAKLFDCADGVLKKFNLFGEHNADFINLFGYPKIKAGSYVGMGTDREDYTVTLTFDFVPKLVVIVQEDLSRIPTDMYSYIERKAMLCVLIKDIQKSGFLSYQVHNASTVWNTDLLSVTWGNKNVSYSGLLDFTGNHDYGKNESEAYFRLDSEGVTYRYVAIG